MDLLCSLACFISLLFLVSLSFYGLFELLRLFGMLDLTILCLVFFVSWVSLIIIFYVFPVFSVVELLSSLRLLILISFISLLDFLLSFSNCSSWFPDIIGLYGFHGAHFWSPCFSLSPWFLPLMHFLSVFNLLSPSLVSLVIFSQMRLFREQTCSMLSGTTTHFLSVVYNYLLIKHSTYKIWRR